MTIGIILAIIQIILIGFLSFGVCGSTLQPLTSNKGKLRSIIASLLTLILLIPAIILLCKSIPAIDLSYSLSKAADAENERFLCGINQLLIDIWEFIPDFQPFDNRWVNAALGFGLIIIWFIITLSITGASAEIEKYDREEEEKVRNYNDNVEKKLYLQTKYEFNSWNNEITAKSSVVDETKYKDSPMSGFVAIPFTILISAILIPLFALAGILIGALLAIILSY